MKLGGHDDVGNERKERVHFAFSQRKMVETASVDVAVCARERSTSETLVLWKEPDFPAVIADLHSWLSMLS